MVTVRGCRKARQLWSALTSRGMRVSRRALLPHVVKQPFYNPLSGHQSLLLLCLAKCFACRRGSATDPHRATPAYTPDQITTACPLLNPAGLHFLRGSALWYRNRQSYCRSPRHEIPVSMGYAIGIDIGTANTRVAVYRNGQVEVIPDKNGRRSMPSYVAFTERCRLFGSAAKAYADSNPESTVYGVKRVLGQRLEQWHVDRHKRISPNDVSLEPPGRMAITVLYKNQPRRILPVQVFGMLLERARANAEAYLGEVVQDVVISLPARFDRLQRLDVLDAAHLVGLNPRYIGTSIESIALYHAFTTRQEGENVYVFLDFGASFFNAGLVAIEGLRVEVVSAASDMDLGGEVLIDRVQFHFAAEIQKKWKWDINTDIRARHRLRMACEVAIRELSSNVSHQIVIDSLHDGKDFSGYLSKELLEELCHAVFDATLVAIDRLFHDASGRESKSSVKHARESKLSIKHGREKPSTRTWRERSSVKHRQKESSTKEGRVKSPVKDMQVKPPVDIRRDKSSVKEIVMVGGCSRIPKLKEIWSEYFGSKPCIKVVNPDEHEVLGCAILAANFFFPKWLVIPIIPLNFGLKIEGGMMNTVVPRNTSLPTTQKKTYCLSDFALVPHERPVLHFYQGNRKRVKDNLLIGTLDLSELPPKWNEDRSKTEIEITCHIDYARRVYPIAVLEGKSTSPTAWNLVQHRSKEEKDNLIAQAMDYEEDDRKEALNSRLSTLEKFQRPTFQTKKMVILLDSVGLYRIWLNRLRPGDVVDFAACHRTLDEVEQGLELEKLRAKEISEIRSYAEDLRTNLLAATQSPRIQSLLSSVDSVTKWVDENEEAEIKTYQEKLLSLMALSVELVALNETSNEASDEASNEAPNEASSEATPSRESTPSVTTPQSPNPGPQAQFKGPRGFNELFPESGWDTKSQYTDSEFENVASYLRNTGHENWSEVPRIYTVLRLVGQVELVDAFLQRGMTDIWFPFSDNTLPKALKQPHRSQFLQTQEAVFSKALKLERGAGLDDQRSQRKHAHFSHSEPLPFKVIGNLGSGAHGVVDKVVSILSYKEYARKRFKRPLGSAAKQTEAKSFLNEVKILKTLCHRHCIDLVCLTFALLYPFSSSKLLVPRTRPLI